ncbi:MAG: iron ABC transporter permease [Spirochaetales bacterium]|jgi:iron complex transport system permease protein|nr:iron ABC transporter permease [Spirochaetales bacterium]
MLTSRKHTLSAVFLLAGSICALSAWILGMGAVRVPPSEILNIIAGRFGISANPPAETTRVIIENLRLPRIIASLLVGAALASSGAALQALYRNPMADPYIIGISSSASLGAIAAFSLKLSAYWYGPAAFTLSLLTALFLYSLSRRGRGTSVTLLLLFGIGISALYGALGSFLLYGAGEAGFSVLVWLMGYLGNIGWEQLRIMALPVLAGIGILNLLSRELNLLLTGEEEALYLGMNVERVKKILLAVTSLITALSVAYGGVIGFVGLVVPHCLRLLFGANHKRLVPLASLGGALFLLLADTAARTVMAPIELPLGVLTSAVGAPVFLFLLLRSRRSLA